MRFIAVQFGARRSYAVPEILERAGILERFYTDICGSIGIGHAAKWLRRFSGGGLLQRLHSRQLPRSLVGKTRTFDWDVLQQIVASWRLNGDPEARFQFEIAQSRRIGHAMIRAGFGSATHVYSMLGEGGPLLAEAKRCGLTVVSDVYILLSTERILAEERKEFPAWEPAALDYAALRRKFAVEDVLLKYSDYFVCPSEAVRDDLATNWRVDSARTTIVATGTSSKWLDLQPKGARGRVLFVGTAELRKGIHYLADASERIKARGYGYEFRIAGNVDRQIAERPECRYLSFLGRVPRDRIHEEFASADVFVLPSLAEGTAGATYEALASGLPVVTTKASGSVVRHGIEGLIVPERDAAALAEAIVQIIEDRAQRERMAIAARERARSYTWDYYGERLIAAIQLFAK